MSRAQLYDTIGAAYTVTRRTEPRRTEPRRTEPRIATQVWAALGDAQTVLNVGAGTGFYEAYWRRPEAYLDEDVRRGMSIWAERNRDLVDLGAAELGERLLIA
jgi:hypothetical protein